HHRFAHALPPGDPGARRFTLRDPAWENALGEIVDRFDVGAAHVHHLGFWPVGFWRVLRERGIPFAYTAQDYYCVCPSWNLLDVSSARRCPCTDGSSEERRRCLTSWFDICALPAPSDPEAVLRAHRAEFGALLEAAHVRIAGCDATRAIVDRAFPDRSLVW